MTRGPKLSLSTPLEKSTIRYVAIARVSQENSLDFGGVLIQYRSYLFQST